MDQKTFNFILSIVRQILEFQKDGYESFSLQTGNEPNPSNLNILEECVVLDMTLSADATTADIAAEETFNTKKTDGTIPPDEVFSPKPRNKTTNYFYVSS